MRKILSLTLILILLAGLLPVTVSDDTTDPGTGPGPDPGTDPGASNEEWLFKQAGAGDESSLALGQDGSLWGWGGNIYKQLGLSAWGNIILPAKVMDDVAYISTGRYHTLAVKTDGSLWVWGRNNYGQLGNGTTEEKHWLGNPPEKIMDGVAGAAAGDDYSMAVKTDGSLWAWGRNNYGQLGDGTTTGSLVPTEIMDGVASVSAGRGHTLAVKTDGTLWAWGFNADGQVGSDSAPAAAFNRVLSPYMIMDGVVSASAAGFFSMAVTADGRLWAWGSNNRGQLGDGTRTGRRRSPGVVMDGVASVSAGADHVMAVKTDGSLWAWGSNNRGQLGNGHVSWWTAGAEPTPFKVMDGVASVSAGVSHTLAIKTDGSLWAWGNNWRGQLGDGTTEERFEPVRVLCPHQVMRPVVIASGREGTTLNLTEETIDLGDFAVAGYSVNGGARWVRGALPAGRQFNNLFNRPLQLRLASALDDTGRPAQDAEIVTFPNINARPRANPERVRPYYSCDDWSLVRRDGSGIFIFDYEFANSTDGRTPNGGWTRFSDDGVNGWLEVRPGRDRPVFLFRMRAAQRGDVYTPMSREFRIRAANRPRAPRVRINYRKEEIRWRRGMIFAASHAPNEWHYALEPAEPGERGESGIDPEDRRDIFGASGFITAGGTLFIRREGTGRRPGSEIQELAIMPRAVLPPGTLACSDGRITADLKQYEIFNPDRERWGSLPRVGASRDFRIRLRATASNAASNSMVLRITWGVYDTERNRSGIISAEILPRPEPAPPDGPAPSPEPAGPGPSASD
jgi:alpha-tubulin suppressor-like RCC1 family protein